MRVFPVIVCSVLAVLITSAMAQAQAHRGNAYDRG